MLPESVTIGSVAYTVAREVPAQEHSGETDWARGRIAVHPRLQGEMAVGVFIHEVTHALAYASGQHLDTLRGEEYVSSVGHVLHEFARANPEVVRYLSAPDSFPLPGFIASFPYRVDIQVVTQDELAQHEIAELSPEDCTLKIRGGLNPDIAAWEIARGAISFGLYRMRATETGDRYAEMVFPVAGLFIDTIRRNPELTALLLEPIQRDPGLELVVNNDAGPSFG